MEPETDTQSVTFEQLAALDGLITSTIGETLYHLAAAVPVDRAIVELGSYRGKSTAYLAAGARSGHGAPVWAVDAWSEDVSEWRSSVADRLPSPLLEDFRRQLDSLGLNDRVTAVQSRTVDAARAYDGPPVELLYIDADHSKRAAVSDFMAWRRHLKATAAVVFDDYETDTNPGVAAAVSELQRRGRIVSVRKVADRLAICRPSPKGLL